MALRSSQYLWRLGCWVRAACVAGMWICAVPQAGPELWRVAVQLGVTSAGLVVAFLHSNRDALEWLSGTRMRLLKRLNRLALHLLGTPGRAKLDASGMLETVGALTALWVFVGPLPVVALGPLARVTGVLFGVAYSLSAAGQAVIDPGWYSPDHPPSPAMRRLRSRMPFIFAGMLVVYLFPYNDLAAELPLAWYIGLFLTPFTYFPLRAAFEAVLDAGYVQIETTRQLWRLDAARDTHSLARNAVSFLSQYLEEDEPDLYEIRRLTNQAQLGLEEFRRSMLGAEQAVTGDFAGLWGLLERGLPAGRKDMCVVAPGSGATRLAPVDFQIARRVLPDLLTNALHAGANRVEVSCRLREPGQLVLTVIDDGPGLNGRPAQIPGSSSWLLRTWLESYDGGLSWSRAAGRTTARARWQAQQG